MCESHYGWLQIWKNKETAIGLYVWYYEIVSSYSKPELINDASIKKLITEQMMQWSEMIDRHRKEEWDLMKAQLEEQREAMNKVIEIVQATQMKQLEAKYER